MKRATGPNQVTGRAVERPTTSREGDTAMAKPEPTSPRPAALQDEHVYLGRLLRRLDQDLACEHIDPATLADEISALIIEMERHFVHEEQGGYFATILEDAPQFQFRVQLLEQQHEQFRADLRSMQQLCYGSMWGLDRAADLRLAFHEFVRQLQQHERAERSLFQEALTRDVSASD
jgi:hypothetical protein